MTDSTAYHLSSLFRNALQAMVANRQAVNRLDGYNGNHGDNMIENLGIVADAAEAQEGHSPAEALRYASGELQARGRGGTSQYYARGLSQAAEQLQGHADLRQSDVMSLVQTLLGAIPSEGHPQQVEAGGSVLDLLLRPASEAPSSAGGDMLGQILGGLAGGQQAQAEEPENGLDVSDVLGALLPVGLAFLQAKESGAENASAAGQALMGLLMGGGTNPLQAHTPRAAAGGLIAQSILHALTAGRS